MSPSMKKQERGAVIRSDRESLKGVFCCLDFSAIYNTCALASSPPKAKPASLGRLSRLLGFLGAFDGLPAHRHPGLLSWIVDIVPRNVEEDGLDRDHLFSGREFDNVFEIGPTDGVFIQLLDKGNVAFVLVDLGFLLPQVVNVNNGAVALQLAINHPFQELDGSRGNVKAQRGLIGIGLCIWKLGHSF